MIFEANKDYDNNGAEVKKIKVDHDMLDDDDFKVNQTKRKRDEGFQKYLAIIRLIWHHLSPLNSDLETVIKEYDTLIVNYFTFFRFFFLLMLLTGIGFLYLCIEHLQNYVLKGTNA